MSSTSSLLSKISNFLVGDVVFLLCVLFILFVVVMYVGRGRVVSFILAFYPATILYKSFPFMEKVIVVTGENLITVNKLVLFLVFLVPLYLVINRYVSFFGAYGTLEGVLRNLGFAIAILIILVVFSYTTLNLDSIHNFGPKIDGFFSPESRLFWWNLAPLALLGLL